jgi:hypothetical protein
VHAEVLKCALHVATEASMKIVAALIEKNGVRMANPGTHGF